MAKQVLLGSEVRSKMVAGARKLAHAVKVTLGPKGRNVAIEKSFGSPLVTKDGVSVAKEIELHDPWENLGARLLREVSSKTSEDAGDGTTTSTVLGFAMLEDANRLVSAGFAPIDLKRGMDIALEDLTGVLEEYAEQVSSESQIERIATISANGDEVVGRTIAEAIAMVGKDGVVNIEEGKTTGVEIETTEGMQLASGLISSAFFLEPESASSQLENPWVFVSDMELTTVRPMMDLLEEIRKSSRPVIWIAPDFDGEALNLLCTNFGSKVIVSQLVKAPSFGAQQKEILKDIAVMTGATFVTRDLSMRLSDVTLEHLGSCRSAKLTLKTTTILDGAGSEGAIEERVKELQAILSQSGSQYDQDKIQERISKLRGGVCLIKVGADTELELKELKGRLEDALYASRSALEEGTVQGGGMALYRASEEVEAEFNPPSQEARAEGWRIVLRACKVPFRAMLENAYVAPEKYEYLMKDKVGPYGGVNVRTLEVVYDLREVGVIDPVKVVRMALANAVSLVGTAITTEAAIVSIQEDVT